MAKPFFPQPITKILSASGTIEQRVTNSLHPSTHHVLCTCPHARANFTDRINIPELVARGNERSRNNGNWAEVETVSSRKRQKAVKNSHGFQRKMAMIQTLPLDMITKYDPQFHVRSLGVFFSFLLQPLLPAGFAVAIL